MRAALVWGNRPVLRHPARRSRPVAGRRIVVTGASSGVGRATAARLASEGASVVAVARRADLLADLADEVSARGGHLEPRVADLADHDAVAALASWCRSTGGVDTLVNNAGRSVRRATGDAVDRLDDIDRMLAVNYVGAARLTLLLLSSMTQRADPQVVNVGTWTVPVGTSPRFAAYHASKAAMAGFGRCLEAELAADGLRVSAVHLPLVHTAMSAPTERYRDLPGLTAEEAAAWVVAAVVHRPTEVVPRFALALRTASALAPRAVDRVLLRWG